MYLRMIVLPNGDLDLIAVDHSVTYLRISFKQDYHSFIRTANALLRTGKYHINADEKERIQSVTNAMRLNNPYPSPEQTYSIPKEDEE